MATISRWLHLSAAVPAAAAPTTDAPIPLLHPLQYWFGLNLSRWLNVRLEVILQLALELKHRMFPLNLLETGSMRSNTTVYWSSSELDCRGTGGAVPWSGRRGHRCGLLRPQHRAPLHSCNPFNPLLPHPLQLNTLHDHLAPAVCCTALLYSTAAGLLLTYSLQIHSALEMVASLLLFCRLALLPSPCFNLRS